MNPSLEISTDARRRALLSEPLIPAHVAFAIPAVVYRADDECEGAGFVVAVEVEPDRWEMSEVSFGAKLRIAVHAQIRQRVMMGSLAALRWPG